MSTAKQLLQGSPVFDLFLSAAEDFGTAHGPVAHYGTAHRDNPVGRRRFGWKHWVEFEMVTPNEAWSGGPECVRRFTGAQPGWRPAKRWRVLDLDQDKTDGVRTADELVTDLSPGLFCLVPTRKVTNWQAWFLLAEPLQADDFLTNRLLRDAGERLGGDRLYSDTTIAHNPVHRSLTPWPDGRLTWWNPELAEGVIPSVSTGELLARGGVEFGSETVGSSGSGLALPVGSRYSTAQLIEAMAVAPGPERARLHWLYVLRLGCEARNALGRDPNYDEVLTIAVEGAAIFPSGRSDGDNQRVAAFFLATRPWEVASARGRHTAELSKQKADQRFREYEQMLSELRSLETSSCPPPAKALLTPEQRDRATDFTGRKGTASQLGHVLGISANVVRQVLHQGRRRQAKAGDELAA